MISIHFLCSLLLERRTICMRTCPNQRKTWRSRNQRRRKAVQWGSDRSGEDEITFYKDLTLYYYVDVFYVVLKILYAFQERLHIMELRFKKVENHRIMWQPIETVWIESKVQLWLIHDDENKKKNMCCGGKKVFLLFDLL